jgi:hypothetical protein
LTRPPPPPWIMTDTNGIGIGPGSIKIFWGPSTSATAYYLMRYQLGNGTGNDVPPFATTTSTSYLDTGLSHTGTYFYAVKAGNASGTGDESFWTSGDSPKPCGVLNCSGCCSGDSCLPEGVSTGCAYGGTACGPACGPGGFCASGACAYPCNSTTCPNGCCQNNTCYAGTTSTQCGGGGSACGQCSASNTCSNHHCVCAPKTCTRPYTWDLELCRCVNNSL